MPRCSGCLAAGFWMTASSSSFAVQGLECGYPQRVVISGVDLSFEPGTATAILGPNGSGKSTFLRTLTGELKALKGQVEIGGRRLGEMSVAQIASLVAVVPQQEHIPFRFTAWEIVMMGRLVRAKGLGDSAEDRAAVTKAMEFTDCAGFKDRPVNELSGGERKRVLLARALAQETDIVVLDEPTTHLDVTHQIELCRLVRQMAGTGKTVVAAMHDLNLVASMADRAVLLGVGTVKLDGTVEDVLASPLLDEVYKVAFRRTKDGGKTLILPPSL